MSDPDIDAVLEATRQVLEEQKQLDKRVIAFKVAEVMREGKPSKVPDDIKDHPAFRQATRPTTTDRGDRGSDRWDEGRMTRTAAGMYRNGRTTDEVAAELARHNDDPMARARAMQAGKDQAGV